MKERARLCPEFTVPCVLTGAIVSLKDREQVFAC